MTEELNDDCPTTHCPSFLVRHAWLSMRTVIAGALADFDLSVAQYASLLVLAEQPGMSVADLARKVSSTRQSANEMLTGLERSGLIERGPHPTDRRTQRIHLTDTGRDRLAAAQPAVTAVEEQLASGFSADELRVVNTWLMKMASVSAPSSAGLPTL